MAKALKGHCDCAVRTVDSARDFAQREGNWRCIVERDCERRGNGGSGELGRQRLRRHRQAA